MSVEVLSDLQKSGVSAFASGSGRTLLTTNTTYYVRTDGSNSNTGLVNSSGGAFLTIQHALDVLAAAVDFCGWTVTIQIADGTYTGANTIPTMVGQTGPANLVINGNATTPANVYINVSTASSFALADRSGATISNLKVASSQSGFETSLYSSLYLGNINFGACTDCHMNINGYVNSFNDYSITGSSTAHIRVDMGGFYQGGVNTVTISGTPDFSIAFANAGGVGRIDSFSTTYSGSATGKRYIAEYNGIIYNTGDSTYFPGNVAGTIATGGMYNGVSAPPLNLVTGRTIAITGDVAYTSPSFDGSTNVTAAGTIQSGVVSNAKLATVAANTIKGNNTGSTAAPIDMTVSQTKTLLALNNVDNTADTGKPVSTAQQTAINSQGQPTGGTVGQVLRKNSSTNYDASYADIVGTITYIIDGGGATITTGVKGFLEIPFACTITGYTVMADQSGSVVIDVWKDTYANYPPTVADTITASAKPTLSSATKAQNTTLTGWTTSVTAGDILGFNVDSITTCQRVTLSIKFKRV